jgi:hypothetical protein
MLNFSYHAFELGFHFKVSRSIYDTQPVHSCTLSAPFGGFALVVPADVDDCRKMSRETPTQSGAGKAAG